MKSNYDEFRAYYIMKNGIDSWKTFELLSDQALINIVSDIDEIRNLFPKFFAAYKSGYIYNWNFLKKSGDFWENDYSDSVTWEEFKEDYRHCSRCGNYDHYSYGQCICYAR